MIKRKGHIRHQQGFTLIELIVVMVIISLLVFIVVPKFDRYFISDNTKVVTRSLIYRIMDLKSKAVKDRINYVLHVDVSANKFWISNGAMEEEALAGAEESAFELPDDVRLVSVIKPNDDDVAEPTDNLIFYKKGYSDMAIIHIEDTDDRQVSLKVEPFLLTVDVLDGFAEFGD